MAEKKKWAFIVNPIAGNGFGKEILPELSKQVEARGLISSIAVTEKPGHASTLAESFSKEGFDYIITVGGDGTFNEVAKMLLGNDKVSLGIIPAGTGNDFNQILGFPDRFSPEHWDLFFRENTIMMDYGTCNGIPFFNGMGLGFDAVVAAKNYVAPGETKMGGKGKYLKAILGTLFFFREYSVSITKEGKTEESDCFINTVSNGRRYAGGFYLTPLAYANDGLLDVCMIKKLGLFKRLDILLKVSKGKHTNDKKVNYYRTPKLQVDFGKEVPFHVDGELFHSAKFTIEIFARKISVLYNPEGPHFFKVD